MSKNRLQNYIKNRRQKGGFDINSSTTEDNINEQSTSINNTYNLDKFDSVFKNISNYTEINDWVLKKTEQMSKNGKTEIKRKLSEDEKPLKDTDTFNGYNVVITSANRNDCLIHAFLTAVSNTFRQLEETDKNIVASYFRRIILLWLVLHESVVTPTITKMKNELSGPDNIALQDDVIDYLAGKFKINIYYGFKQGGQFQWMLSQNPIDTKPFIMIINPGAYHYETVCSPNDEYIFDYELIKNKHENNLQSQFINHSPEEKAALLKQHIINQAAAHPPPAPSSLSSSLSSSASPSPSSPPRPAPPSPPPSSPPSSLSSSASSLSSSSHSIKFLYKRTYTAKISDDMTTITVNVYYRFNLKDKDTIKQEILKLRPILMMSNISIHELKRRGFKPVNELTEDTYAIVRYTNDFLNDQIQKMKLPKNSTEQPYGVNTMKHIISINQKLSSTTTDLDKEYYKKIKKINEILNLNNIDQPNLENACTLFKKIHNLLITLYQHLYTLNVDVSKNTDRITAKSDEKYAYIRILFAELKRQEDIFNYNLSIINNILQSYFSTCITSTLKKQMV